MVKKSKRRNKKQESTSQAYRLVHTEDESDFYFVPIDKFGNEMDDVPELNKDGSIRRTKEEKLVDKSFEAYKENERMKQLFWLINQDDNTPKPDIGVAPPVRKTIDEILNQDHITISGFRNDNTDYESGLDYKLWSKSDVYEGLDDDIDDDLINSENKKGKELSSKTYDDTNNKKEDNVSKYHKEMVKSITIAHEVMDEDMYEALFGDGTEEFEELGDDFMEHAGQEPETVDDDFQLHLKEKILQSARLLNFVPDLEGSDVIIEEIEEEEELDGEEFDLSDFEEQNKDHENNHILNINNSKQKSLSSVEGKVKPSVIEAGKYDNDLDKEFDRFLDDYDDEKSGYALTSIEKENVKGEVGYGPLSNIMDELTHDLSGFNSTSSSKYKIQYGAKYKSKNPNELVTEELDDIFKLKDEDGNILQSRLPENFETAWTVINDSAEDAAILENMKRSTPYLVKEKKEEQWDCETIVSTYTNTDNHPTVLEDGSLSELRKNVRNKNRNKKHSSTRSVSNLPLHNIDESDCHENNSLSDYDEDLHDNIRQKKTIEQKALPVITLSRKTGVPLNRANKYTQNESIERLLEKEKEDDLDSYISEAADELASLLSVSTIRKKGESKEEKLARKEAAKDLKRIARQRKKLTKQEYNAEEQSFRQSVDRGKQGGTIEGSVFRYK